MDDYLAAGTAQYSRIHYIETITSGFLFCSTLVPDNFCVYNFCLKLLNA